MAFESGAGDFGGGGYVRVLAAVTVSAMLTWCFTTLSAQAPPFTPYDRNAAILLAGKQVPEDIDSFYFFVLDTETTIEQDGYEMGAVLQRAAMEEEYLGIVGPDPERNRATLIRALDVAGGRLRGVVVIYVGPSTQADDVAQRIGAAGADLRYVVYPEEFGPSI
jgi:hypothetical protein